MLGTVANFGSFSQQMGFVDLLQKQPSLSNL